MLFWLGVEGRRYRAFPRETLLADALEDHEYVPVGSKPWQPFTPPGPLPDAFLA